jgi:hypothetical protein
MQVEATTSRITRPTRLQRHGNRGNPDTSRAAAARRGQLGPYSRALDRGAIGFEIDGRSREGRYIRAFEHQLTQHIGGNPNMAQRVIIGRAARVSLHLELMDERALRDHKAFSQHDYQWYTAYSNCLARLIGKLGIKEAARDTKAPSLSEVMREVA